MADEQNIRVVISGTATALRAALDGAKGDLGGLKAAIKDVPDKIKIDVAAETAAAVDRLAVLRTAARDVPDKIKITADADTGVAEAKLRLLKAQVRDTETSLAKVALGIGSSGSGASGGGGNLFGGLSGSVGGVPLAALPAAAAGALALAGALTAVAGSAGAAALGVGALATSGLGVLAAGLGPVVALSGGLKDAIKLSEQLKTAQDNVSAAVAQFGAKSTQAKTAQDALNKTLLAAPPALRPVAEQFVKVHDTLNDAEEKVLPNFVSALKPVLDTFTALLPTVTQMAKVDLGGISAGLKPLLEFVNSAEFKAALIQLSDTFAKLGGPLGDAFTNIFKGLLNVAVAAAPFLIQIADAFDRWSRSFADSLAPGQHLNDLIGGLVGQLHSWFNLATALGGLMITVFSAGAGTGQTLVNQLTQIVDKWNAWLNTSAGQEALRKFFTDSANLLRGVLTALAPVAQLLGSLAVGLIPTMTTLLAPIASILATISGWVNTLSSHLPPVLNALPGLAVAVGVLAGWKALQGVVASVAASIVTAAKTKLPGAAAGAAEGAGGATVAGEAGVAGAGAGAAGVGLLPIVAGAAAAFVGISALSKAINGDGGVNEALDQMRSKMREAIAAGDLTKIHAIGLQAADMGHQLHEAGVSGSQAFLDLASHAANTASSLQTSFGNMSEKLSEVSSLFKTMASDAGQSLHTILTQAQSSGEAIASTLGTHSTAARVAIATNFSIAAQDVRASMQAGVINTGQGMTAIHELLAKALAALGGKALSVSNFLADVGPGAVTAADLVGAGDLSAGGVNSPHATGGLVQIGRPGQKGRDTIGLSVGGTDIAVGAGEKVAVFNNEQQAVADHFMAPVGGLGGMFKRYKTPHYMAEGGIVPGFSVGGAVAGATPATANTLGGGSNVVDQMGAFLLAHGMSKSGAAGVIGNAYQESTWNPGSVGSGGAGLFGWTPPSKIPGYPAAGWANVASQMNLLWSGDAASPGIASIAGRLSQETVPGATQDFMTNWERPLASSENYANRLKGAFMAFNEMKGMKGALGGAGLGAGGGAEVPTLTAPKVTGTGAVVDVVKAAVTKVTAAANQYAQAHAPAATAGVGVGGGVSIPGGGAKSGPGGLATFEGVTMAQWIANELIWGTQHGWHGQPTSGYRPGFDPHAPSGSEHALINYPGGAVDFGGFTDPAAYATKLALVQLAARLNYPGPRLQMPIGFHDDGHLSGTGHARGGFVDLLRAFAGGGFADLVKTLPPGGGQSVDVMTSGSNDPAGNSGGFNQAGSQSIFGRIPVGPEAGPWWAEGDRGASIGMSFGGKRGGQAARFTYGNKSTVAVKVDTGNGNSYGDLYPPVDQAIGFDRVGKGGPVKVDFLSDTAARALLGDKTAKAAGPKLFAGKPETIISGKTVKPRPFKLPKFSPLPGFDQSDMNQIASIEDYLNNKLSPWQGLITGEHSRQPVVPLVTQADGSQVVNWDGMVDPTTGQFDKGINARLAEIGHLGGSPDINTELGIDQQFLNEYLQEGLAAARAQKQFTPWLSKMQADRQRQLDAADDDQATIDRVTALKAGLPKAKADRNFAITQRFAAARHKLQISSSKGKFSAAQLLTEQLGGLSDEETKAKAGIGANPPDGWKGTKKGWAAQRKRELADLTSEFSGRRQALHDAASANNFTGTLGRSKALFGLTQEEQAEKHGVADTFAQQATGFTSQLAATRLWLARDKRLLNSDEANLTAATGSKDGRTVVAGGGSFEDTLRGLLDPMGPLAINIDTMNKIDIPNLLDEIGALSGTKPPAAAATTPDLTALLALKDQLLAQEQQALAVSQGLTTTLAGFAPLLAGRLVGSFQSGIDFVPQTGLALVHRGETITPDPAGPQGNRAATVQTAQGPVEIVIQMGNNDPPLMKIISAAINGQSLQVVQDHSGQRARLLSGVRRP